MVETLIKSNTVNAVAKQYKFILCLVTYGATPLAT
jgi:hypothetical protein